MSVSPDLAVGLGLTIAGWLGLVFTVAHSRRVIRRLTTPLTVTASVSQQIRIRPTMSSGPGGNQGDADFARELTLLDVTFLGVGAMISRSVFVLTGLAAGGAGPAFILAFALNGVITIFTAMTYAELGSAIPEPGGGYLWVRTALDRSQSFLSGWMSWFAHAVAGSLYVLTFGSFVTLILTAYFDLTLGLSQVQ